MQEILAKIQEYGDIFYVITFIWTAVEGETFVIFAGYAAHLGLLSLPTLIACAWLGSFCGDQVYFFLGRRYGATLIKKFPKWEPRVARAMDLLHRYNTGFILSFRFIYGVRNVSSFAVGMSGISWARFSILNFIAAGVWAVSFAGTGYLFGAAFKDMLGDYALYITVGMLIGFITLAWWIMSAPERREKRLARQAAQQAAQSRASTHTNGA